MKDLIDDDSHSEDCISCIDIRNMMIQRVKKTLPMLERSRISTAGCRMRKTDQDIGDYSVLNSIALTRSCSLLA